MHEDQHAVQNILVVGCHCRLVTKCASPKITQVFVPLLYLYIGPELLHLRKRQRINLNMSVVMGRDYKNKVHETREQRFVLKKEKDEEEELREI